VGQQSHRQRILKEYTFFKVTAKTKNSISVQINLGNLCNLSCLMCDEKYSSVILSENKKLGINVYEQKDFSWSDRSFEHLQQIFEYQPKILTIIGGEPLYIKQFLDILEKMPEDFFKKTMLHITTNATVWNDRWARVIQRFKLARITFSLDATKDLYEYIRFPASWDQITGNIQQITKLKNVKTTVHCVVQNLNIGKLFDIIEWCMTHNLWLTLSQLSRPNYLSLTNLPVQLKNQAIDELDRCLTIPDLPAHTEKFIRSCQTQLIRSLLEDFDQALWTQCVTYLETRDQLRHNSHKNFLIY
jgi:molybdenum cofactor biosynthesis enzyme MoaA